ncbi:SEC-C domain-containing protein (plasmid) [Pontibacillus sp. ALD_SL1]|uniref:YecA family protein n=1 Tax=Pontibacillus sp. ALD_SL1 TaxID=2777185 RepID=UPI001A95D8D2|nr:SEC-C metal-binding domain-containing protein [Pontibacillus sp. ALD_SL1]QST02087.1 SEC-C domain-containing protein [Pontibacillus sp. ALD_SL1]
MDSWHIYIRSLKNYDRFVQPYIHGSSVAKQKFMYFLNNLKVQHVDFIPEDWGNYHVHFFLHKTEFLLTNAKGTAFGPEVFDLEESVVYKVDEGGGKEIFDPLQDPKYKTWLWNGVMNSASFKSCINQFATPFFENLSPAMEDEMEHNLLKMYTFTKKLPSIKRNDPCPCGSSAKYKKCCAV